MSESRTPHLIGADGGEEPCRFGHLSVDPRLGLEQIGDALTLAGDVSRSAP